MSLWEKWEREKLEKMGIKVERKDIIRIPEMRHKQNRFNQMCAILGALVICLSLALAAVTIFSGSRWSDTYIVRLIIERNELRHRQSERQDP